MSSTIFSLLDTPAYGGAEEYLLMVLIHLVKSGNRVVLATNNPQVKKACEDQIEVIDLPYRLDAIGNWKGLVKYFLALPGAILWLSSTLKKFQAPTICLFPGFSDRLSFSPFVKLLGCKLVWLEYGPLEPTFVRNHGFPKLLYGMAREYPDKIVTISEWTKKSLIAVGKIPESKILVIYPGVSTVVPSLDEKRKRSGRGVFTAVSIGRLATEKEFDVLLKAWKTFSDENKMLRIIGDGPEREHLERLTGKLGMVDSVRFEGFVSNEKKNELLSASDVFIFPSAWNLEGFGMTSIEAMAAGLPIISTGYGPQAEVIESGKSGWLFHPHDVQDLSRALVEAYKSGSRKTYGAEGRKRVQAKFSKKQMLTAWETLISAM